VESRPETVGGSCKLAIHGLDPGIPAGMTAEWVLPCVLVVPAGAIDSTCVFSRVLGNGKYQQINNPKSGD
jgi:hypothetical protein